MRRNELLHWPSIMPNLACELLLIWPSALFVWPWRFLRSYGQQAENSYEKRSTLTWNEEDLQTESLHKTNTLDTWHCKKWLEQNLRHEKGDELFVDKGARSNIREPFRSTRRQKPGPRKLAVMECRCMRENVRAYDHKNVLSMRGLGIEVVMFELRVLFNPEVVQHTTPLSQQNLHSYIER